MMTLSCRLWFIICNWCLRRSWANKLSRTMLRKECWAIDIKMSSNIKTSNNIQQKRLSTSQMQANRYLKPSATNMTMPRRSTPNPEANTNKASRCGNTTANPSIKNLQQMPKSWTRPITPAWTWASRTRLTKIYCINLSFLRRISRNHRPVSRARREVRAGTLILLISCPECRRSQISISFLCNWQPIAAREEANPAKEYTIGCSSSHSRPSCWRSRRSWKRPSHSRGEKRRAKRY